MRSRRAFFDRRQDLLLDEGRSSEHHRAPDATPTDDCSHRHARVFAVAGDRHASGFSEQQRDRSGIFFGFKPRGCRCSVNARHDDYNGGRRSTCRRRGDDDGAGRNNGTAPSSDHNDHGSSAGCDRSASYAIG